MVMDPDPRTYAIIGAAMLVHRELGPGYLEATYQDALAIELAHRGVPFLREVPIRVWFRGQPLGGVFRADFLAYGQIIVELKAIPMLGRAEASQTAHYLTATGTSLGLLINFGRDSLQFQRILPRRSGIVGPRHESEDLLGQVQQQQGQQFSFQSLGSAESKDPLGPRLPQTLASSERL